MMEYAELMQGIGCLGLQTKAKCNTVSVRHTGYEITTFRALNWALKFILDTVDLKCGNQYNLQSINSKRFIEQNINLALF